MRVVDGELHESDTELPGVDYADDLTDEAREIRRVHRVNVKNGRKGGLTTATLPAPADCRHCQMRGYTSWLQHAGHLGFAAMMLKSPSAAHIVRAKIKGYKLPPAPEPEIPF